MSKIREGIWLCKQCGSVCRGRDEECNGADGHGGCGVARPKGTQFKLVQGTPYVTDIAQIADAESGVDWHCDHCSGANKGSVDGYRVISCVHCGHQRDANDTDNTVQMATTVSKDFANTQDRVRPRARAAVSTPPVPRGPGEGSMSAGWLVLVPVLLIFGFFLWSMTMSRTTETWHVAGHAWSRTISTEAYTTLEDAGWSAPADANILTTETRVRRYVDVVDHYEPRTRMISVSVPDGTQDYDCGVEDLGNGYFRDKTCTRLKRKTVQQPEIYDHPVMRTDPVYDEWMTWTVDRWIPAQTFKTSGHTKTRAWAEIPVLAVSEREDGRTEVLEIRIQGPDRAVTKSVTDHVWEHTDVGDEILVETNYWGGFVSMRDVSGANIAQ